MRHHDGMVEHGPTVAERRAVQKAVDAGDMKRAQELLSAIRRRLHRSENGPRKRRRHKANSASKRKGPGRLQGEEPASPAVKKAKPARKKAPLPKRSCARCGTQFKPNSGRQKLCSLCRPRGSESKSVRTVSGGLPGLGKRH